MTVVNKYLHQLSEKKNPGLMLCIIINTTAQI